MLKAIRCSTAAFAAALVLAAASYAVHAAPTTITFLHTNDVYEISPKGGRGGLAELMTLLKAERANAEHSITTFGGDLISPSVMSGLTKGTQMIELMNALGTDVAVPGNHEFDFGPEIAAERIADSKFPWLGTNILGKDGMQAVGTVATHVISVGDYQIGFLGLLAPETDTLSSPGGGIKFTAPVETAKAVVKELQAAGADVIVALTHLTFAADRVLAREVKGINLILGGHDHDPITFYEGGVLIHKAGYDAHYLAAVDLVIERVERRGKTVVQVRPAWRMISTAAVAPDPAIKAIVDKHNATLDEQLNVAVGKTAVELDSRRATVRTMESNLGDLIADAMRAGVGADVALTNGGGIRGDRTYDPGTTLTRRDILSELPFGNVTILMEISGSELLAALENGVSEVENGAGRFPQISGMTLVYDPSAPKGSRVIEVRIGGKPLDKAKTYRLATNDYMASGGDGYAALKSGKVLVDASGATLMATTVMNYISAQGSVTPKTEGRIKTK